jgi:hypothetical protein
MEAMGTGTARDVILRGRVETGQESGRSLGDSYHAFAALNRHLGNLHGVPWLAIKGVWSGRTGEFKLYLRVQGDPTPFIDLMGERLRIGKRTVLVEYAELCGLLPHPELFCPYVVISPPSDDRLPSSAEHRNAGWWKSEEAFKASVERHLQHMGVKASVAIGELEGIEMGKKWVEERKTEDLWVGGKV